MATDLWPWVVVRAKGGGLRSEGVLVVGLIKVLPLMGPSRGVIMQGLRAKLQPPLNPMLQSADRCVSTRTVPKTSAKTPPNGRRAIPPEPSHPHRRLLVMHTEMALDTLTCGSHSWT